MPCYSVVTERLPRNAALPVETGQIASDESTGPQQREISLARDPGNEKDKILRALELSGGNKTKAANLLKVDRKTLYNKMHQYGIDL